MRPNQQPSMEGGGYGTDFYWSHLHKIVLTLIKVSFSGELSSAAIIFQWCGGPFPATILSSGPAVFIHFITNSNIQKQGFQMEYKVTDECKQTTSLSAHCSSN